MEKPSVLPFNASCRLVSLSDSPDSCLRVLSEGCVCLKLALRAELFSVFSESRPLE
jgi:hypothetical protein